MIYLCLRYDLFELNDTLCIYDVYEQKTILALSIKNNDFHKIKEFICLGFNEKDDNPYFKLTDYLYKHHSYLFTTEYKNRQLVRYFRNFNSIHKESFVMVEGYVRMLRRQNEILIRNTLFKLNSLDISYFIEESYFNSIPFIEVVKGDEFDLKLISNNIDCTNILNININDTTIFIGPLVIDNDLYYQVSNTNKSIKNLLHSEKNMISLFVEKITILLFLDLIKDMRYNYFLPFNFRLSYNRITGEILTDTEVEVHV